MATKIKYTILVDGKPMIDGGTKKPVVFDHQLQAEYMRGSSEKYGEWGGHELTVDTIMVEAEED